MAAYLVMKPPKDDAPPAFVRDGFSLAAFLVPPLWLLWHRMWIEAALVALAMTAIGAIGEFSPIGPAGGALSLLVSLYVGLENAALRIGALRRRGFSEWGVVEAESREDAEIRFFAEEYPQTAAEPPSSAPPAPPPARMPAGPAAPALGLLSYPGRS